MDQELREALNGIMGVASEAAKEARSANANSKQAISEVERLRRDVFGSLPPPPNGTAPPGADAATLPLARRVADSHAEITVDVDDFKGNVLREIGEVRAELARQSQAMGIGASFWRWLRTREGKGVAVACAAAIAAAASWMRPAPAPARIEVVRVEAPSSASSAAPSSAPVSTNLGTR